MEYVFKTKLEKYQINELQKRLPFLSEDKISYSFNYQNGLACSMSISASLECNIDGFSQMLDYLLEDIYKIKKIISKVFWEKDFSSVKSNLQDIIDNGYAYKNSIGQITLKGELLKLFGLLDKLFDTVSQQLFDCEAYQFPVLLPTKTLEMTGYFEHNPYQWMKVNRIKKGMENYQLYAQNTFPQSNAYPEMCDSGYSLPPTMCYYVYDMLKGSSIDNSSYTTSGRSFRYEGDCDKPFERLIDFTIRETVFVGTKKFVEYAVDKYMSCVTQIMDILGVCGKCETANDIFFMTDRTAERLNIQKMLGSKYELLLYTSDVEMVAAASFNKHGNFIGNRFDIHTKELTNPIAYSACVGIGLERLVFACVTQLGLDNISIPVNEQKGALPKVKPPVRMIVGVGTQSNKTGGAGNAREDTTHNTNNHYRGD